MRKLLWTILLAFAMTALAACTSGTNKETEKPKETQKVPQPLKAVLEVPEKAAVKEEINMKVTVSQGDEKVADADKVAFEVWEDGKKEESKMIKAKNNEDGTYEAKTAFDHDGLFTVQVHVDARALHTMPLKPVTVGEGAAVPEGGEHHEHGEQAEHHHHGDHSADFSMHFIKPENVKANTAAPLTVHLQLKEAPLENAQVRYEIWNNSHPDKHDWVDVKENKPGEYSGSYTFADAGTFIVKVHVENKEGLHEHEEHQLEVTK
ncbi:hypothetical protein AC623_16695 [Bacillus sp. FJAT-27231]|uniref:FixH family protein n=1 Tax=Bacillus sp. FJAT-27231 TaxID=1679168 RepID=UPI000671252A|nr:FixH family protein [Bacillus sp. FJAT-27231]KMY55373.1 hypothetical protein AC623_16695 [Bacillus sp. FJAT-27231]